MKPSPTLTALWLFYLGQAANGGLASTLPDRNLAFSPLAGTTLVYSLTSRLSSEGKSFLGQELGLGAQASGQLDLVIRQKTSDNVFVDLLA